MTNHCVNFNYDNEDFLDIKSTKLNDDFIHTEGIVGDRTR